MSESHLLPEHWRWTTLGSIADVKGGLTKGKRRRDGVRIRSVPYLRVANVQRGFIDLTEVKHIDATESEVAELALQQGDILLNEGGDRDKLGRGWVWDGQLPECIHQNHVFRARLKSQEFNPRFVSLYANSAGNNYFQQHGAQTTNLASINSTKIKALPLPHAPRDEQDRIVAEIEKQFTRIDAAAQNLRTSRERLRRYRTALLAAAIAGRLVPTTSELADANSTTFESGETLLSRILADRAAALAEDGKNPRGQSCRSRLDQHSLPDLPNGWAWARVDDVGFVQLGRQRAPQHHSGPNMRPYLRVANVYEDRIDTSNVMSMNFTPAEFERYRLQSGDVLLNEGQSLELVGRPAIFKSEVPDACFQNTLVRFRSGSPGLVPEFALTVFRAYLWNHRFRKIARWTTNIAHLGAERFASLEFPLPPTEEQLRIVAAVNRHESTLRHLETTIDVAEARSARLRGAILRSAFSGQLSKHSANTAPEVKLLG